MTYKTVSEAHVESCVCEYARSLGWLEYKFTSPSSKGVPDRIFIRDGVVFFIEFKRLDEECNAMQKEVITTMRNAGVVVHVIDNEDCGKNLFTSFEPDLILDVSPI